MSAKQKKNSKIPWRIVFVVVAIAVGIVLRFTVFRETFRYAGTLEATKVDLSSEVPSKIEAVKVYEGDHIKDGQELVDLSCEDIKVASDLANENYQRALRLYKGGSGSQESLDQMKNRNEDANVRLHWCLIQSPIHGTVLSRYHEPGEWVMPGTKLLTLANIRDIWAYIYVPQPEVAQIKPGMKLKAYLPEKENQEFQGTVLKINDEAEFTPKNVQTRSERQRLVFGVKVSFLGANEQEILKPGMTIEVQLPVPN
jgi:HlyD family secretion protein